jgi:hypothetical protein
MNMPRPNKTIVATAKAAPHLDIQQIENILDQPSFNSISESAFAILRKEIKKADPKDPLLWLYGRLAYISESTSTSIRLLASTSQIIPAIALARVRLEQMIISSYLMHEEPDVALVPYLKHHPIDAYRSNKNALANPDLAKFMSQELHDSTCMVARAAKFKIDPSYDGTDAILNRSKWTSLDLLSMAKKRDAITRNSKGPSASPMELSYTAFYRDFSSIVHSNSMGISPDFIEPTLSESGGLTFRPLQIWSQYLAMTLASWDTINVCELMEAMDLKENNQLKDLNKLWIELRDSYFDNKDKAEQDSGGNG